MGEAARRGEVVPVETVDLVGDNRPWFVVATQRERESFVKAQLERQGFDVYLPMCLKRVRDASGRGFEMTARPFFPRYVFVRVTPDFDKWRTVFSTMGVAKVFCTASGPIGVRAELIKIVRAQEVEGFLQLGQEALGDPAAQGDLVTTLDGLVQGVLSEVVDEKRGRILVNWLGGDLLVTVDLAKVAKVPADKAGPNQG